MTPAKPPLPAVAGLVLIALVGACAREPAPALPPRLVATQVAGAAAIGGEADYSGEIRPRQETALSFRIGGKLVERSVEVGQSVRPGQILARLDASDVGLNASAARATLAAAESDLAFARAEHERYSDLRARNFVSQAALDAKAAALTAARGKMEAASAQAGLARNQSAYASLAADAAGVVSAVLAEAGQVVAAGQPVLRIARPGEMEVAISVPENRVAQLRAGDGARISLWAESGPGYAGRVREIAPMADPVTRTYAVRISLLEPGPAVRLGMTANVRLRHAGPAALRLPATALFQQDGRPAVWVVGADQTLALRPVEVASFAEDGVLVSAGVQAGERIVTAGVHKLTAGEKVRLAP